MNTIKFNHVDIHIDAPAIDTFVPMQSNSLFIVETNRRYKDKIGNV